MTEYNLGHVVGEKGPKGDTTHAVTGNAVYAAIQQIRTEIGEAIQYNGIVEQPQYLI